MKTVCVYHSRDLDGWMSAAEVKHWWTELNKTDEPFFYTDDKTKDELLCSKGTLKFIGWDYGQPIPNLEEYNRVIMVDVSFPNIAMQILGEKGINFIWIDHHISAINENKHLLLEGGKRDPEFAACELTWQYFFPNDTMPEIVRLLGRYDCFGHKGTSEELKVLEFQYGARTNIHDHDTAYQWLEAAIKLPTSTTEFLYQHGASVYQYLCTEAKQIYKRAFPISFEVPHIHEYIEDLSAGSENDIDYVDFLCVNQDRFNPINFGIDYHKDGYDGFACFWFANGKWNFSLYNDNGEVDCSLIAKQYSGGGHKGAAGFVTNDLKSILGI